MKKRAGTVKGVQEVEIKVLPVTLYSD
jgi:hypothetical protein